MREEQITVIARLSARIAELDEVAQGVEDADLAKRITRVADLLREMISLLYDMPDSFSPDAPWWMEWAEKNGLVQN